MARYDERKELAPRDVVARAIDAEIKRRGEDCAWLDMSHMDRSEIEHHFPTITEVSVPGNRHACRSRSCSQRHFCGGVDDPNAESDIENFSRSARWHRRGCTARTG